MYANRLEKALCRIKHKERKEKERAIKDLNAKSNRVA